MLQLWHECPLYGGLSKLYLSYPTFSIFQTFVYPIYPFSEPRILLPLPIWCLDSSDTPNWDHDLCCFPLWDHLVARQVHRRSVVWGQHICLSGLWCLEQMPQMRQEDPLHGGLSQLSCLFSTSLYPITYPRLNLCILFLWCVDSSHTFQLSSLFRTFMYPIAYTCLLPGQFSHPVQCTGIPSGNGNADNSNSWG